MKIKEASKWYVLFSFLISTFSIMLSISNWYMGKDFVHTFIMTFMVGHIIAFVTIAFIFTLGRILDWVVK